MIKVIGQSKLGDIIQALIDAGTASIVCGECSRPLLQGEKKVEVAGIVYCKKHALAAANEINPGLTEEAFDGRSVPCTTRGLKELGLYIYAPTPKAPTSKLN